MDDPAAPDELHALRTKLAEATDELTVLRAQLAALRQERDIELLDREWSAAQDVYEVDQLVGFEDAAGANRYIPTRGHSLGFGVLVSIPMILIIVYAPRDFTWIAALLLAGIAWWTVDAVRKASAYVAAESSYRRRRARITGEAPEPHFAESHSGESALEDGSPAPER